MPNCPYCWQILPDASAQQLHIRRAHPGQKSYICSDCSKAFAKNCDLKRHALTHTGEKPYACPTCGQAFRQHSALTEHKQTHTGEKPYACPDCEGAFPRKGNLKRHMRTVHAKLYDADSQPNSLARMRANFPHVPEDLVDLAQRQVPTQFLQLDDLTYHTMLADLLHGASRSGTPGEFGTCPYCRIHVPRLSSHIETCPHRPGPSWG